MMTNFSELAHERYSVRKFKSTPVEEEKIEKILEAARIAPTACNYQPQMIYVLRSEDARQKLARVTPCTFNAPLIFVIGYDENVVAKGMVAEGHNFGQTDCAIVCTHMVMQAWDLGLGSCYVGRFWEKDVKAALNLPENIRVCLLLPVGYADAAPSPRHTEYRPAEETIKNL